ncbi:unnamed protein product [Mytilus coruscus]|uniref:B box-type domain-containing protein n=1 Tax=Mytilus coruscus TaxID=42192 RepID=A0A6J8DL83_MYTCO|nr:unnamed protein product [Mytilus coruscus]
MSSDWSVCGVCDYRNITKSPVVWCSECEEGLCKECKDHHGISKGSRNHDTVSIAEYQKLPNEVLQLSRSCNKHNEKYVLFCKKHDCPCCKKCVVESHTECKELTDIDDITRNIKSSNAFADIEQTLLEIAENIKRLRINREDNLTSIGKKRREIEKEVLETRDRINLHLDKLQDAALKELKTKEEEERNKIRRSLNSLKDKEKEIVKHQTNLANIKQYASELQTFLALKHIDKDVIAEEKYIQSIVKDEGANQIDLSCKINPSMQGLLSAIKKFGDVVVTAHPCNIQILNQKDKQAQMMVALTPLTINSLAPTLQQTLDTNLSFITGCAVLPDCRMVLSCLAKQIVQVFKPEDSLDFDIGNFGPVFDVAYTGDNTVALTSGYGNDSLQIKDGIQIINLNDKSMVNVTKTNVNRFAYVATLKDNIFYTDCGNNSVTCIDFQGIRRWTFRNVDVLKAPLGISVDEDENVYVVGGVTNNVVVISPNGQHHRQLLTSDDGLKEPAVIHVDHSNNKMLVANTKEKAFVYNLR